MPQVNPKVTLVAINNDAGAFTVIRLTTWAKYLTIDEDKTQNGGLLQGLQYNLLDPFAQSTDITAGAVPTPPDYLLDNGSAPQIAVGDSRYVNSMTTAPLGNPGSAGNVDSPGGTATLGTPILQVRTASANATKVIVREYA